MAQGIVIIPTFNEIENIEAIVKAVFALPTPFHVLIVDDNSPDGTAAKVEELQKEFPGAKGYSAANLWRMRNFYLTYRNSEKLAPMVREISWNNNIIIMEKGKDNLQRGFYIRMTKRYGWTKRVLANSV